jgi:predicted phosphodiesterase
MRIVAVSDMHNDRACVRKLRAWELNDWDVIAIRGEHRQSLRRDIFETL